MMGIYTFITFHLNIVLPLTVIISGKGVSVASRRSEATATVEHEPADVRLHPPERGQHTD